MNAIDLAALSSFRGEGLWLRIFTKRDISLEYLSWLNDRRRMRYSGQRHYHHTKESCSEYADSFDGGPNVFWAIRRQGSDELIGTATAYIDPHSGVADVGILVGPCNEGIGTRCWGVIIRHLLDAGVRKVTAGTLEVNRAMVRIMLHWGMTLEGSLREQDVIDGRGVDMLLFGLLRDRWMTTTHYGEEQ